MTEPPNANLLALNKLNDLLSNQNLEAESRRLAEEGILKQIGALDAQGIQLDPDKLELFKSLIETLGEPKALGLVAQGAAAYNEATLTLRERV